MTRTVDNHELLAQFIDEKRDGDTFWYTELLDRRTNGSNRFKLLRSFEHDDRAQFLEQWPTIKLMCDRNEVRAYLRLSPRSRKRIAKATTEHLFKTVVLDEVYDQVRRAYASVCGKHAIHDRKLWLFDIDSPDDFDYFSKLDALTDQLARRLVFVARVPTRAGCHLICKPHFVDYEHPGVELHKDNPTVLYAPENAA